MEDIIPFLLALAYIIFALYKKSNKAKKQQKPVETKEYEQKENEKQPDFKKVLEEIIIGRESPAKPVTVPYDEEADSLEVTADEALEQLSNEQQSAEPVSLEDYGPVSQVNKTEKDTKEDSIYQTEPTAFDFDLRMAIIYSEILKRPHF